MCRVLEHGQLVWANVPGAQGAAAVVGDDLQQGLQQGQVVAVWTLRQLATGHMLPGGYAEWRVGLTVGTC